jgi:hypothetical protein
MSVVGQTYTVSYECSSGNDYDGRLGVRISSIFVIGFGSLCGMSLTSILLTSDSLANITQELCCQLWRLEQAG